MRAITLTVHELANTWRTPKPIIVIHTVILNKTTTVNTPTAGTAIPYVRVRRTTSRCIRVHHIVAMIEICSDRMATTINVTIQMMIIVHVCSGGRIN